MSQSSVDGGREGGAQPLTPGPSPARGEGSSRGTEEGAAASAPLFRTRRRVEFRDTDAAGIVHFSQFFVYMEQAEQEFLRSLGLSVVMQHETGKLSFPRVAAQCNYRGPIVFEDVVDIDLSIARRGDKSLTYDFVFKHDGRPVAEGRLTCVCCRMEGRTLTSIPIPDWIIERLPT